MTKTTSAGVFQLPNGMWGFRYAFMLDGKQKDIRRNKGENGNPFITERAAIKAREATIIQVQAKLLQPPKPAKKRMTVAEVYAEYCETGRYGKDYGTTRKQDRPNWNKLIGQIKTADTIVFDSVSRMSRNADEGFKDYKMLYEPGVHLVFLNEPLINTSVFDSTKNNLLSIDIATGNSAVDAFFKGNIELINNFMMALAEEQIKAAFDQAEKEVTDLHSRISQGMREAKKNGTKIGISKGTTLTTKKSIDCKAIIQKHSKDFGGSLEDADVIKLCGCSRNSYYKYKRNSYYK